MIKQLVKGKPKSPYRLCSVRSLPGHPQTPSLAAFPPLDHCAKFYFSTMISNIPSTYSSSLGFGREDRHNALTHWSTNSPTHTKTQSFVTWSTAGLCVPRQGERRVQQHKRKALCDGGMQEGTGTWAILRHLAHVRLPCDSSFMQDFHTWLKFFPQAKE